MLKTKIKDHFLHLILDRPEKGNAIHPELARAIRAQVVEATKNNQLLGICLSGSGKNFCSGADLDWVVEPDGDFNDFKDMYQAFIDCDLPVIGSVHGKIMGAGVGLTSVCDVVLCESHSEFSLPEAKWGLIPGIVTPLFIKKAGPSVFAYRALTGTPMTALEGLNAGLVHEIADASEIDKVLGIILQKIAAQSPTSLKMIKKSMRECESLSPELLATMSSLSSQMKQNFETRTRITQFLNAKKGGSKA